MSLMILAACSGTGKSTITKELLSLCPKLRLSVSHTTRQPRAGEIDGVHYHFISRDRFLDLIRQDAFVEYAEYAGNFYGTSHHEIQRMTAEGLDILFDVEIMGAGNLKKAYPEAVSCFVLPPSWHALEERLRNRGTETAESLEKRLNTGKKELKFAETFDFIVINDQLAQAVTDLKHVYLSSQLKTIFQKPKLNAILNEIMPS
jgi:guanylate kinase